MSQLPNQFPAPQGYGPNNQPGGGSNTALTVIGIVSVVLLVCLAICGIFVALLFPALQKASEHTRRLSDSNNMKQIGLAFHNYQSAFKYLPAPIAMNSKKEKVWSWSISILPFCEQNELFSKIDFRDMKPWNDPANSFLQGPAPGFLQSIRADTSSECHVFVISAPTLMPSGNPLFVEGTYTTFSDVRDGLSNTIMAIQLVKHGVPWASPTTLSADEAYQLIQNEDQYVLVGMADGSVKAIPADIDQQTFNAMVTRDGMEAISIPEIK